MGIGIYLDVIQGKDSNTFTDRRMDGWSLVIVTDELITTGTLKRRNTRFVTTIELCWSEFQGTKHNNALS